MSSRVAQRMAELGLTLPAPYKSSANYVGAVLAGSFLHISGQGPIRGNEITHRGKVPDDQDLEAARDAARISALNIVAQASAALGGDLDRVARVVKLFALVNCTTELNRPSRAIDAASQLMLDVFGTEIGAHPRVAIAAQSLPFGITCEIDAVFQVREKADI